MLTDFYVIVWLKYLIFDLIVSGLGQCRNRFVDVYDLIFFSSCDDGLEGEDKCRFDLLVCDGRGGAMFRGLEVITGTDSGADVLANVCS